MVERLIPRESTNHTPCLQASSTTQLSNKILCLALFWVPVLETWLLVTFRSSLPVTISVCLLSSVSAWARLSFHLYLSHSRHLGFSPLWCTLLTYSERSSNPLSLGTSNMSLVAPNLFTSLFFQIMSWALPVYSLKLCYDILYLTPYRQLPDDVSVCLCLGMCMSLFLSVMQSTNTPLSVLSIVLGVETQYLPFGSSYASQEYMLRNVRSMLSAHSMVTHYKVCQVLGCEDTEVVHNISWEVVVPTSSPFFIPSILCSVMN